MSNSPTLPPLDHFAAFCERFLTLDNGKKFKLEDFQRLMLTDMFDGARETVILLPKKQGKTTLMAALSLYHVLMVKDADCVIAAASRDQAGIMLRQAQGFIRRSAWLTNELIVKQREIVHKLHGGRIRILASDVDTADGVIPTLALVDELHRHKTADLYGVFRDGLGPRDGKLVTITTAGADQNSVLWRMRQRAIDMGNTRDGAYMRAGSKSFVLHEWSLPPDSEFHYEVDKADEETKRRVIDLVKTANPLKAVSTALLRERHDSPSTVPWQWARFACNVWTQGEEAWLPIGVWDSHRREGSIPDGASVWLGIDLGLKHDSAAIVAVANEDELYRAEAIVLYPPTDGTALDISAVEAAVRACAEKWDVQSAAYDPWRFERSAQILGDEGLLMVEHPMTNVRMAPESEALHEAIMAGHIVHDGDEEFASHVNAGVPTETERGWRLTKRKAKDKIDALIALLMAYDLAARKQEPAPISTVYIAGM